MLGPYAWERARTVLKGPRRSNASGLPDKVSGEWRYLYRAVDQFGQVIDVMLSERRDAPAARRFFQGAMVCAARPVEVTTDRAAIYPPVLDELLPGVS